MICPPYLKKGDTVAITAPASIVKRDAVEMGIAQLKKWGLNVIIGETVGNAYHNFSGTDELRRTELQGFLNNPNVHCIIAARGGYGVSRILDDLDFTSFCKSPKWIVGFSDLTALISQINTLNIAAIHGPMVKTFSFDKTSNSYLKNILFGENLKPYTLKPSKYNRIGNATGQAIGGNLCLLNHLIGTKSEINFEGKILFIEDISEYYYAIDRYLVQLKRAGKIKNLAGLVVGNFSDFKNQDIPFGKSIEEITLDHCSEYTFPIAFGFNFGHEKANYPIVMGGEVKLEVSDKGVVLLVVSR
jgi:muramoyltetrapeptide carboxypeptidase